MLNLESCKIIKVIELRGENIKVSLRNKKNKL